MTQACRRLRSMLLPDSECERSAAPRPDAGPRVGSKPKRIRHLASRSTRVQSVIRDDRVRVAHAE
jgi:hypothetical protein